MADENKKTDSEPIQPQEDELTVLHRDMDGEATLKAIQSDTNNKNLSDEKTIGATQHDAEMTQIDDYDAEQGDHVVIYFLHEPVFAGWYLQHLQAPSHGGDYIFEFRCSDPHGPPVLIQQCVDRMENDGSGESETCNPMNGHPRKFDSKNGQK